MADLVTIHIEDHIADVRLNRPDKYNALSAAMFRAIKEAGERLADNREVRAVVLSGNGPGFCAGLDMELFQDFDGESGDGNTSDPLDDVHVRPGTVPQLNALVWKRLPVPVIGAIHGVAFGGGAQLALGPDIRIAAPDARMSIMEIKWGLIPDMSITQTLRDLVPLDVAKELTFTGRIISGTDAKDLGLVTHVSEDPLNHAMKLAREIASKSPDAVRAAKHLLETAWRADEVTGLDLEAKLMSQLGGSENQVEAMRANFEKRDPIFKDAK